MSEDLKKKLSLYGGTALVAVLALYTLYQGREILFGSTLSVKANTSVQSIITLTGNAGRARKLIIDGRTTALDSKGTFSETVALLPGENIITVSAVDQFGKSKTQTIYSYQPTTIETAANIPPKPGTPPPKTGIN